MWKKLNLSIIVNLPNWDVRSILNLGKCSSIKENFDITQQYTFLFQEATTEDDVDFDEEEELVEEAE
jgi:hypothetical protein